MASSTPTGPYYLCHACAARQQLLHTPPADVLGTPYQLGKYIKHTEPDPQWQVQSVFEAPDRQQYRTYVVQSLSAGSVEVDRWGRTNVVWVASEYLGFRYEQGRLIVPQDAVKVVRSSATGYVHAFPVGSTTFTAQTCRNCDARVIQ